MPFTTKDIPDLSGKVYIVTGASAGIGYITTLELARKNGHVIMATRSKEKTLPLLEKIKKETNNDKVEFMELDLTSLKSVDKFADDFLAKNLPLHCLVNNAGIMAPPYELSQDEIESQFATNHIGHFHLTNRLLPLLEKSAPSRIVNLSSIYHKKAPLPEGVRFDKINDKKSYDPWVAYGQSKLSNILFTRELVERLQGKQIWVNAVHPGYVRTELQRNFGSIYGIFGVIGGKIGHLFALSPLKGSLTSLYVATSPEIETKNYQGEYFVPIATLSQTTEIAKSKELAKKLWEFSEKLVQEKLSSSSSSSSSQQQQEQKQEGGEQQKQEGGEQQKQEETKSTESQLKEEN